MQSIKKSLTILLLLCGSAVFSQINNELHHHFFANNAIWRGDTTAFSINAAAQVQTNASSSAQTVAVSIPNHLAMSAKWEFFIHLKFDPSSSNRVRIYLIADNSDLKSANGYFIQIGENGSADSFDLYLQRGENIKRIIDGPKKARSNPNQLTARVQVKRNAAGLWELKTDNTGDTNYVLEGTAYDATFSTTAWLGIQCNYTASRSAGFIFSDFTVESLTNDHPPKTKPNDIVINEILAKAHPQVALPNAEFVELKNNTDHPISLKNWIYSDAKKNFVFDKDSIYANEYLIICAQANTNLLKPYGRVIGIDPWPSLNNSEDQLSLKNEEGTLINEVHYTDSWFRNTTKKDGGWTLELINPKAICSGIQNWGASIHPSGGTPGHPNSIYNTSTSSLRVKQACLLNDTTVLLTFNQSIDEYAASIAANYTLSHGMRQPILARLIDPHFGRVALQFRKPIPKGNTYTIKALNITDCNGSPLADGANYVEFMVTKPIATNDILISEVLFNPRKQGVDFVEIYNNSAHTLNLQELSLATISKNMLSKLYPLSPLSKEALLLQPKQYLVLSTNPDIIKQEYHSENPDAFLKMLALPPFNDKTGTVILISDSTQIDQLDYSEDMHFKFIKNREGISLERSSFTRPTNELGNFRSAASAVGFATPGYKNSQHTESNNTGEEFSLASKTFSPDNDGFEDVLQINYQFAEAAGAATIDIYNDRGVFIKQLINNKTLGTKGTINWDGFDDRNEPARAGIYTVHIEQFDMHGQVKKDRIHCGLARPTK